VPLLLEPGTPTATLQHNRNWGAHPSGMLMLRLGSHSDTAPPETTTTANNK